MTESMPSRVQPAHAPQKPAICWRESGLRVARATDSFCMNVCGVLEELGDGGLDDLAHGVAGKRIEEEQAGGKLVGGEGFGGPGTEGGEIEFTVGMKNDGCGDALAHSASDTPTIAHSAMAGWRAGFLPLRERRACVLRS